MPVLTDVPVPSVGQLRDWSQPAGDPLTRLQAPPSVSLSRYQQHYHLSPTLIYVRYIHVCVSSGVTLISSLSNTHIFIPMCMTCGVLLTLVGLKEVVISPFNSHTFVQVRGSKHGHILHTSR